MLKKLKIALLIVILAEEIRSAKKPNQKIVSHKSTSENYKLINTKQFC